MEKTALAYIIILKELDGFSDSKRFDMLTKVLERTYCPKRNIIVQAYSSGFKKHATETQEREKI
tara:strand:+ start:1363 stop:1554 length:192 start_codon:yes stop_codon:yes gene_type:complete